MITAIFQHNIQTNILTSSISTMKGCVTENFGNFELVTQIVISQFQECQIRADESKISRGMCPPWYQGVDMINKT